MKTKACEIYCNIYEEYKLSQEQIDTMFPWIKNSVYLYEFFKINELQVKPFSDENIFSSEDFITANDFLHRKKLTLKLSNLLFHFCNYGKASFELVIEYIHQDKKEITTFFHFNGGRFPAIIFADLMPFNLDSSATWVKPKATVESVLMQTAHQFRALIRKTALGNSPTPEEFQKTLVELCLILDTQYLEPCNEASEEKKEDSLLLAPTLIKTASQHANLSFAKEFAMNIAKHFFTNYGINLEQIQALFEAFVETKKLDRHEINEEWIDALLIQHIDAYQCSLKLIFPKNFNTKNICEALKISKTQQTSFHPV